MIPTLSIQDEIRDLFPDIRIGMLTGQVINRESDPHLFEEIELVSAGLRQKHSFETIREIPPVESAKNAYRMLGKDPNRYRISAEAMIRRIVKGQSLYQINTVVDCLNLVSIRSGVTIGGFDLDYVQHPLELSVGQEDEEFEAIGRGLLNIHRLPVYRDSEGAIGSPTSDCTRTMLRLSTQHFLMIITDFFGQNFVEPVIEDLQKTLGRYADGKSFDYQLL